VKFSPAIAASRHRGDADGTFAPLERSTHTSTVTFGLHQSMRTMLEAAMLLQHSVWSDWSPAAREYRNRFAGRKDLNL